MAHKSNVGYLEIILGCMYAGKTSRLVEIYNKYAFCNQSIVVINHFIDNRYDSGEHEMSTHNQIKIQCIKTNKLFDLSEDVLTSNVILINEGQFFDDLEEFVKIMLDNGKKIYVCGLDGDFERNKFGKILNIIPLCDKVEKLVSLCAVCRDGTPGIFSKRITLETEQTLVGSENYIPVCRSCYDNTTAL